MLNKPRPVWLIFFNIFRIRTKLIWRRVNGTTIAPKLHDTSSDQSPRERKHQLVTFKPICQNYLQLVWHFKKTETANLSNISFREDLSIVFVPHMASWLEVWYCSLHVIVIINLWYYITNDHMGVPVLTFYLN